MAVLTQIDQSKPIDLCPYQFDLMFSDFKVL